MKTHVNALVRSLSVRAVVVLGFTALASMGCGTTMTARAVIGEAAPPHRRPVAVFLLGQQLPSDYVEVALVQANGRGDHSDAAHVFDGLRREAAVLGCDAVIAVSVDAGTSQTVAVGVAVRWITGAPPDSTPLRAPWAPRLGASSTGASPTGASPTGASPSGVRAPWSLPPD